MASPAIPNGAGKLSKQRRPEPKRLSSALLKAKLRRKQQVVRRRETREIERRMETLREEMREIGEEQRKIREGQREVRVKSLVLASECRRMREETDGILKQSAATQEQLGLMFAILRARDCGDSATANELALRLREMISSSNRKGGP